MPHINVNDISIFYEELGRGPTVVFAHAYMGRTDVWAGQRIALAGRYRIVAYDARGHGRTTAPTDPAAYGVEESVSDLVGLLDTLDVKAAHLCGLSMGAEAVLHTLLRSPERVLTATLADCGTGSDDPAAFREYCLDLADAFDTQGSAWTFEHRLSNDEFVLQLGRKRAKTVEGLRALVQSQDPKAMAYSLRGVIATRPSIYSLEERLRTIDRPVLILRGALDVTVANPAAFLARTIPAAEEIVLPDVGHVSNIQAPGPFNAALSGFLDRHSTS